LQMRDLIAVIFIGCSRCQKSMDGSGRPHLSGLEYRARKVRLVRRVRKVLRLERDAVGLPVQALPLAQHTAGEEIAGVELQAGLGRQQLEHPARGPVLEPSRAAQPAGRATQDEIVVIAASDRELRLRAIADTR